MKLQITGLDEVARKFKGMEDKAVRRLEMAMKRGILTVHQSIPPYPTRSDRRMVFVSAKQRRWFFWALKSGLITVPYRRTNTLGRSITTFKGSEGALSEARSSGANIVGVIGTAIPYAQYVVGDADKQARIHKGYWWQLLENIKKNVPKVTAVIQAEVDRMIKE